jgi:hypothetical protein
MLKLRSAIMVHTSPTRLLREGPCLRISMQKWLQGRLRILLLSLHNPFTRPMICKYLAWVVFYNLMS